MELNIRTDRMEKSPKISKIFHCENCLYTCCKQSEYNKHLFTPKHINRTKMNVLEQNISKISKCFTCKYCSKCYNARNSLWYHEKKCIVNNKPETEESLSTKDPTDNELTEKELIMMIIKEHSDIKQIILELVKNGINNSIFQI